jgi:hypothetical protein
MHQYERAVIVVDRHCRDLLTVLAAELTLTTHPHHQASARELVEALTHYCASVLRGHVDGASPFDFANYLESGHGQRWF